METGSPEGLAPLTDIVPNIQYKPTEIAKKRFILNSSNKSDYHFILKLINRGKLATVNYFDDENDDRKVVHNLVMGDEIIRFRKEYYGM